MHKQGWAYSGKKIAMWLGRQTQTDRGGNRKRDSAATGFSF